MYIVYSFNLKTQEICSRNVYVYRDDAIRNLVDEAIQYVATNKREGCTFVEKIPETSGWYVTKSDKDEQVDLHKVSAIINKGWVSTYETFSTEKIMMFSIIIVPEISRKIEVVQEIPKITRPIGRNNVLQDELFRAVTLRREKFSDLQ